MNKINTFCNNVTISHFTVRLGCVDISSWVPSDGQSLCKSLCEVSTHKIQNLF